MAAMRRELGSRDARRKRQILTQKQLNKPNVVQDHMRAGRHQQTAIRAGKGDSRVKNRRGTTAKGVDLIRRPAGDTFPCEGKAFWSGLRKGEKQWRFARAADRLYFL